MAAYAAVEAAAARPIADSLAGALASEGALADPAGWHARFDSESPPAPGRASRALLFPLLGSSADLPPRNPRSADLPPTAFLAHGSYGAASLPALDAHAAWLRAIERNPVRFFYRDLFPALVAASRIAAALVRSPPTSLVLVPNVEVAIAATLASLVTCTDHRIAVLQIAYGAVTGATAASARRAGSVLLEIPISSPITPQSVIRDLAAFLDQECHQGAPPIRLIIIEHITSPTALILPIKQLTSMCKDRGILTLIDGAHAIGQLDLNLSELGVDLYTTNAHKWLCSTRGCALFYIDPKLRDAIHPLITTWGAGKGLHAEFIWQGTNDYCAQLSLPTAVRTYHWLGGEKMMERNRRLASMAATMLVHVWETDLVTPDATMFASMVTVRVPAKECNDAESCGRSDLHDDLIDIYNVEVPVFVFRGARYVRVSVHVYNCWDDLCRLAEAMLLALGHTDRHPGFARLAAWKRCDPDA